jgi:hypothetical protein
LLNIGGRKMSALVQALSRISATASSTGINLKVLAAFCLTGLVISLIFATGGADFGPAFAP